MRLFLRTLKRIEIPAEREDAREFVERGLRFADERRIAEIRWSEFFAIMPCHPGFERIGERVRQEEALRRCGEFLGGLHDA